MLHGACTVPDAAGTYPTRGLIHARLRLWDLHGSNITEKAMLGQARTKTHAKANTMFDAAKANDSQRPSQKTRALAVPKTIEEACNRYVTTLFSRKFHCNAKIIDSSHGQQGMLGRVRITRASSGKPGVFTTGSSAPSQPAQGTHGELYYLRIHSSCRQRVGGLKRIFGCFLSAYFDGHRGWKSLMYWGYSV